MASKIKQFWMVVPLDVKEDPGMREETAFAQPARPRTQRGIAVGVDEVAPVAEPGRQFTIPNTEFKRCNQAFTTKSLADSYAKEQAEKNPKVLYGVFGCEGTFETTTPTVIQKKFNEDGELTPVQA